LRYPALLGGQGKSTFWRDWLDAIFPRDANLYMPEDEPLRRAGLPPVRAALSFWANGNDDVLSSVDPTRLLILRTEDIDTSVERLAAFCGIDPVHLRLARANVAPSRTHVLDAVPADWLVQVAEEACAPLMHRFWGADWRGLATPTRA
jgi:hypothetical protein